MGGRQWGEELVTLRLGELPRVYKGVRVSAEVSDTRPYQRQLSTAYCFSERFNIDGGGTSVTRAEAREQLRDYCSDLLHGRLCDPEGGVSSP